MMRKVFLKALKMLFKQRCEELGFTKNDLLAKKVSEPKGLAYSKIIGNKKCALVISPSVSAREHVFCFGLAWCLKQENFENDLSGIMQLQFDDIPASGYMAAEEIWYEEKGSDYRGELGLSEWSFSTKSDRLNEEFLNKNLHNNVSDENMKTHVQQWLELIDVEEKDYDGAISELQPVVDDMFTYVHKYVIPFFNKIS
jgi:hypothetical protein